MLCFRCRVSNRNDEVSCHQCHDTKDAIVGSTSAAEHASLLANTQGSSYGRALQCLKDRDQRVALGAPVEMGAPGYVASIRALVASINVRSDASRVERTVDESVGSFDGYLALKTSGRLRFWTADDVHKCMRSGELEAMIAHLDHYTIEHPTDVYIIPTPRRETHPPSGKRGSRCGFSLRGV